MDGATPWDASQRTRSRPPGISGATVMIRIPGRSGSSAAKATSDASMMNAGFCAPFRWGEMNGPSRLKPSGADPSAGADGIHPRTRSANACNVSSDAVTAVGRNEVTPWRRSARAMPSRSPVDPIASWPPHPCT